MKTSRALNAALFAALTIICQTGFAQNLIAPRPITSPQPPQPTNAAGQAIEGWVNIRYSVLADGTPTNVEVINVMPPSIDPAPVLQSVAQWTFSPGMRDGVAIDWHNNESKVVFRSQGGESPTAAEFADSYASIGAQLEAENFDAALPASERLIARNASTLAELGLALVQNGLIHVGLGDYFAALESLRMATDPRVPMLSGPDLFSAVQLRMQAEQQLNHTLAAIQSYKRLARGIGPNADNPLEPQGTAMMQLWDQAAQLAVNGKIDDGGWRFDIGRRYFYIAQIDGNISTINAECDTQRLTIDFDPDADYTFPDSFGACTLFVHGDEGTTFSLIEALPPA